MSDPKSNSTKIWVAVIGAAALIISALITRQNGGNTANSDEGKKIEVDFSSKNNLIENNSLEENGHRVDNKGNADNFTTNQKTPLAPNNPNVEENIIIKIRDINTGTALSNVKLEIEDVINSFFSNENGEIKIDVKSMRQKYGEFGSVNAYISHSDYKPINLVLGLSESQTIKMDLK